MPRNRPRTTDGRANNGGARQGQPGRLYPNRSDMRTQKVQVGPSAEYGQGERLRRAQQAVPVAATPPTPPSTPLPGGGGGGGRPAIGDFGRPSDRPNEPLTTGIAGGAGAGPEALAMTNRPDPELEALRPYLPTLELLASQPNASPSARMFVKRLRGTMPPPQR